MEEADKLCQRIAVMDHGKILVNETPDALKKMIPGGTALEVQAHAAGAEDGSARERITQALGAIPSTKVEMLDDGNDQAAEPGHFTYRIYADSVNGLIGPAAQAVLSTGAEVRNLSVKQPSLEEVFIFLTGRHLR